jgi:hypothetical protein
MPELQSTAIAKGMIKKVRPARPQPFLTRGAYSQYVSTAKWRPFLREALRRRQGTPLAAFFNIPILYSLFLLVVSRQ